MINSSLIVFMALLSRVYQSYRKLTPLMLKASDLDPERKIDYYFSIEASGRHQVTELINLSKSLRQILRIYTINIDNFSRIKSHSAKGADLAGLLSAERVGVKTGGIAPAGWRTEKGAQPETLRDRFGLTEHSSSAYPPRTEANVVNTDATIIYATNSRSPGTVQTVNFCVKHGRPYITVNPDHPNAIKSTQDFLNKEKPTLLNVAGNRESKSKGITKKVARILYLAMNSS